MFKNQRYITKGVQGTLPPRIQTFLWYCVDSLEVEADYLQVFRLEPQGGQQYVTHEQEHPPYRKEYAFPLGRDESPVTAKLYAIDDGDHSTLLLSDEY